MLIKNFEYEIRNEKRDSDGNFLALDITIEDNRTINIYGPNYDGPEFLTCLKKLLQSLTTNILYYVGILILLKTLL